MESSRADSRRLARTAGLIGRWIIACLAASMRIRQLAIRVVIWKLGEKGMGLSAICRRRSMPTNCREIAVNESSLRGPCRFFDTRFALDCAAGFMHLLSIMHS